MPHLRNSTVMVLLLPSWTGDIVIDMAATGHRILPSLSVEWIITYLQIFLQIQVLRQEYLTSWARCSCPHWKGQGGKLSGIFSFCCGGQGPASRQHHTVANSPHLLRESDAGQPEEKGQIITTVHSLATSIHLHDNSNTHSSSKTWSCGI